MSEKRVLIVTIVALALVVIAGAAAIWWFQFNVLAEKEQKLIQVKDELRIAEGKVKQIEGLRKAIAAIEKDIEEKQKRIPNLDRAEYDKFANLLDEKRRRAGVFVPQARWVTATRPQAVAGRPVRGIPPSMHKVQYDMQVRGGFYQLLKYVNLIEEDRRFINVENFSIMPSGGAAAGQFVRDMRLTLYSFTYRPQVEAPLPKADERRAGTTTAIPE